MDTPEGNSRRSWSGPRRGSGPRGTAGGTRATVLGSLTIPGRPEQVATARAFVARTLSSHQVGADHDAATLLTSEIVTNAVQHTKSGVDGGTVTIVVIGVPHGVLVEIIDDGSAGTPGHHGLVSSASGLSVAADRRARRPAGRRADRPPAQPSGSRPADPALGRGDTARPGLNR